MTEAPWGVTTPSVIPSVSEESQGGAEYLLFGKVPHGRPPEAYSLRATVFVFVSGEKIFIAKQIP